MKKLILGIALAAFGSAAFAQTVLKTRNDSINFALGVSIGNNLKQGGFENINPEMIRQGMAAFYAGDKSVMDENASMGIINGCMSEIQAKKAEEAKKAGEKNLAEGKKFLEENKKKKGVTTTASGLEYEVIKMGNGVKPTETDNVKTHYHGTLIDGTVFDSSVQRGQPVDFGVNQVIKGWTEALQLMPVGSKWKLYIPSELAYGEQGAGGVIGPNCTLIFEVELIAINKPEGTDK